MQNVLITGGAGFIGSNFVRYLLKVRPGIKICNLDILTYAGNPENLQDLCTPQNHTLVQGDICDFNLVMEIIKKYRIDTIVHFAAESHVDRSIIGPRPFIQTNIIGTFNLLEAARLVWMGEKTIPLENVRFHHISTDEVYGSLSPDDPAFTELTRYTPNSPYSASKASSDHLVNAYHQTYGLPVSITNCSNNYGPYQFPEKLIPLVILNGINGLPLPIYGDGKQVRDWLFVEDHCEAILRVIEGGKPGDTYNIGGNNQPFNLEIVRTICSILDNRFPSSPYTPHEQLIKFVTDRPGHDRRYAMDIRKIKEELGWQPRYTLAQGLEETVDWYIGHSDWVEAVRKKGDYQGWMQQNYQNRGKIER